MAVQVQVANVAPHSSNSEHPPVTVDCFLARLVRQKELEDLPRRLAADENPVDRPPCEEHRTKASRLYTAIQVAGTVRGEGTTVSAAAPAPGRVLLGGPEGHVTEIDGWATSHTFSVVSMRSPSTRVCMLSSFTVVLCWLCWQAACPCGGGGRLVVPVSSVFSHNEGI